jgi:Flp pilus assembly protein CpaB
MILTILDGTGTGTGSGGGGGTGSRRRYLLIGLLAVAIILVAVLGFRQIQRLVTPQREVWVASSSLPAGTLLGPQNLRKVKVAASSLPKGVVADARALAGREIARPKAEGEPFQAGDFAAAQEQLPAASEQVPEGRVLTTVRIPKAYVPYKNLKNGDRIDLIAVARGRGSDGFARVVARDAYLVGFIQTVEARQPQAQNSLAQLVASSSQRPKTDSTIGLILALHPEDAVPLTQSQGHRDALQVVLHGQTEVASGQLLELPEREAAGVEYIAGSTTTRLMVTP